MIYQASQNLTEKLLRLPESGMGYQFITATPIGILKFETYIVFNCQYLIHDDDRFFINRQLLFKSNIEERNKYNTIDLIVIRSVNESRLFRNVQQLSIPANKGRHSGGKAAIDSDVRLADGISLFVRLSAFENDRRIDTFNNRLLPGSFTTTEVDYMSCIYRKDDPVDRYALPNDDEIKWAFYVRPLSIDKYQQGIVQPAYGHAGGGVEAFFADGTSKNTYLKPPVKYGEIRTN